MRILITILLLICPTLVFGQYVASTLQQRIDNDNNSITLDQNDIAAKQADIDSIVNDQSANEVTAQVADVKAIQAQQLNEVSVQPSPMIVQ